MRKVTILVAIIILLVQVKSIYFTHIKIWLLFQNQLLFKLGEFDAQLTKCNKGSDCAADECCLSDVKPIGRRRRQVGSGDGSSYTGGHCAKKPKLKEPCTDLLNPMDYLNQAVYECPCETGSVCVRNPNAGFIVPIGYQGTCL